MAKQETKKKSEVASEVQKLVPSEHNGKWIFIDKITGEVVVPYIYNYTHLFSVGLALVQLNDWWDYID